MPLGSGTKYRGKLNWLFVLPPALPIFAALGEDASEQCFAGFEFSLFGFG